MPKTIHLLDYCNDPIYRRAILGQINCGEGRHELARRVCHGNKSELPQPYQRGQKEQIGALGLVVNCIVLDHTIYTQRALDPLVLAIQDFHAQMSMTWSRSALPTYLYGYVHEHTCEADGLLRIVPQRIKTHRWGTKEVASAFFTQPGADNISAVIFNSSATLSKFNRIGRIAGFGSDRVRLVRRVFAIDPDPNSAEPREFVLVIDNSYSESWIEGMDVYHNPRAANPLDPAMLRQAAHYHFLCDGQIESVTPAWHPLASITTVDLVHDGGR